MLADIKADRIKELTAAVKEADLTDVSQVKAFVRSFTTLVYDFQMVGYIYDFYREDVEILRENRIRLKGVDAVVRDRQELLAAFPDLTTRIDNIIVSGSTERGYKIFRRMRYEGSNSGHSRFGPPTGKSLGNACLGLTMFYLAKKSGKWQITHEMDMRSAEWMEQTMR